MGLGLLRKAKNFSQVFGKKYENEDFWKKFGIKYYDNYKNKKEWVKKQEILLIEHLKTLEFDSVLEFGCGFGRTTKILSENFPIQKFNAFDLSSHQIENAKKYCEGLNIKFMTSSLKDFDTNEKFDLVFGPEILMHIEPKDIEFVIKKMMGFANKYFIATVFPHKSQKIHRGTQKIHRGTHTFYHDYEKIYEKIGLPQPTIILVDGINEIHIIDMRKLNQ
jgi:trans-aconitate methyltransferase